MIRACDCRQVEVVCAPPARQSRHVYREISCRSDALSRELPELKFRIGRIVLFCCSKAWSSVTHESGRTRLLTGSKRVRIEF